MPVDPLGEAVGFGVGAGVAVGEAVGLGVGAGVAVGAVGATVGGFVGGFVGELLDPELDETITSCGGCEPSRDESETAVLLVVDSPRLNVPLPVIAEVTLALVQAPAVILPELPSFVVPSGGELALVMVASPQVLSATE
jgi:hypothetical protein